MIACLGWGSLVWDPRSLPIKSQWFEDGPTVKVDFLSMLDDGRMTLMLDARATTVHALRAITAVDDLREAMMSLAHREKTFRANDPIRHIGSWTIAGSAPVLIEVEVHTHLQHVGRHRWGDVMQLYGHGLDVTLPSVRSLQDLLQNELDQLIVAKIS